MIVSQDWTHWAMEQKQPDELSKRDPGTQRTLIYDRGGTINPWSSMLTLNNHIGGKLIPTSQQTQKHSW